MMPDPVQNHVQTEEIYIDHVLIGGQIRILSKPIRFSILRNTKYGSVSVFNDETGIAVSTRSGKDSMEWARKLLSEFVGITGAYL